MRRLRGTRFFFVSLLLVLASGFTAPPLRAAALQNDATQAIEQGAIEAMPATPPLDLDDLEHRTFEYFWKTANPQNGLVPDHWPLGKEPFASIAAVGFALTAYPIGVERGWVTREQARVRVLATLRFFANAPQGDSEDDDSGYHGFFYHFLDMQTGKRYGRWIELSTIDTSLLMAGVLFDQSYFDGDDPQEKEIRDLADKLYRGMDWNWMQVRPPRVSMGWTPGGKFIPADWDGYDEGMILYVLALGSPTHPVAPDAWKAWASTYDRSWGSFMGGKPHIGFAPLFGHQFSQSWIDFRGIRDAYMRRRGLDYFENSARATIGQRAYAIANPLHFKGYGENVWGLTACNGPGEILWEHDGEQTQFSGYSARGADVDRVFDDGTLAPTAAISSIVFTPEISQRAMQEMYRRYGPWLYSDYGFKDAFNPSFELNAPLRSGRLVPGEGWFDDEYLGIDQGPILLMLENYRSGFVWKVMRSNPYIRKGLQRAGFKGGWLGGDSQAANVPRKRTEQRALAAAR
ncbi:MAG TPA: glucoamylase family protein [Rhodanobacteraceae bacterium]|nr:glucoamylase family protein [Rhodanobacteraceae bacterium]